MKFPDKTFSNFNHSPKAINSLITQSACEWCKYFYNLMNVRYDNNFEVDSMK